MVLLFSFWCLLAVVLHNVTVQALRCRTEDQQMDMQFEKVLQICKRRNSILGSSDFNSRSTESDSSEGKSNSDEDIFSKNKFFARNQDRSYTSNQRDRNNGQNRMSNSYSNNRTDVNRWNTGRNMRGLNNQQSTYSRAYNNRNNAFDRTDNNKNYFNRDQACVFQCFFNEFNAVDQRGFPMKHSVIRLMKENVQDPELQDFIQESFDECFRFLQLVNVKDSCEFSQNLITCVSDKAKERCDDWEG